MKNFNGRVAGTSVMLIFFVFSAKAQPCVNGISTDPYNPINSQFIPMAEDWFSAPGTYSQNPWLTTGFNWYLVREIGDDRPIRLFPSQVSWAHAFNNQIDTIAMLNPYSGSMGQEFKYMRNDLVNPAMWDYRWEDGWELLWMNMGYYPDGFSTKNPAPGSYYDYHDDIYDPLPSNIPYFVIYNRYRGLMRIIANVWYPVGSNYSNINVALKFTRESSQDSKLTGIFRHISSYDVALSLPTSISAVHSPRFHAPNFTQWIVADFQMAYDPCSCQSQGELIIEFTAFNTLDVDIIGRSIALEVPINESSYTTRNFMNLSDINAETYVPGTEIYQNMDSLASDYRRRQLKYLNDLNTYNQLAPLRFAMELVGIKAVGEFLSKGITNIVLTDTLYSWIRSPTGLLGLPPVLEALPPGQLPVPMIQVPDTVIVKAFTDKAKKEIGRVFGNFSAEIFSSATQGKPVPPTVPVATLEESVYKGTINGIDTAYSSGLLIPGSLADAYPNGTTLEPHRIPAYNEVLGQTALLETPAPIIYSKFTNQNLTIEDWWADDNLSCGTNYITGWDYDFKLRFDEDVVLALNGALDFDLNRTQTYVNVEIFLKIDEPELWGGSEYTLEDVDGASNMVLSQKVEIDGGQIVQFNSDWIPLEELNQYVLSLELKDEKHVFPTCATTDIGTGGWCTCHDDPDVDTETWLNGTVAGNSFSLAEIKLKLMHDMYFDQIGSSNEQVNTVQVHTYQLYDKESDINYLDGEPVNWSEEPSNGTFNQYIPGSLSLGNETINTNHPAVNSVVGNEIFINAQHITINGPLQVQSGYTAVIQALEEIKIEPDAVINPKVLLRIKKDFYNTPVFEYADNATVYNFCNNSGAYQANTASKALRDRIQAQQEQADLEEITPEVEANNKVAIYPNPTNGAIQLRSSNLGISQVDVYDIAGRLMLQRNYGAEAGKQVQMDIENLQTGVYIVQIHCGAQVHKEKLVVGL